eukprot:TRINITY_DN26623_c0_g1_i2.p1 TRINITY_DN26623_c0_g1~~TRINITY_DN26623_c0_g1_i2.p1  ORF type:complete len:198 (-),score=39.45 TRINITY_DN26623_c0_g1_i2:137-730(-)
MGSTNFDSLEIPAAAWASLLAMAATVPRDMEGLMFGHVTGSATSFLLVGPAGSASCEQEITKEPKLTDRAVRLVLEKSRAKQHLLGWFSVSRAAGSREDLTELQMRLHKAIAAELRAQGAAASKSYAGCIVIQRRSQKGAFAQEAHAVGPQLHTLRLRIKASRILRIPCCLYLGSCVRLSTSTNQCSRRRAKSSRMQ